MGPHSYAAPRINLAKADKRQARTLLERDYLLQVNDLVRQGGIRFTAEGSKQFLAPPETAYPACIISVSFLAAARNVSEKKETTDDLRITFPTWGLLGGARPKASVQNNNGKLLIAKFPKNDDEWDIPLWEYVSFELAKRAGLRTRKLHWKRSTT